MCNLKHKVFYHLTICTTPCRTYWWCSNQHQQNQNYLWRAVQATFIVTAGRCLPVCQVLYLPHVVTENINDVFKKIWKKKEKVRLVVNKVRKEVVCKMRANNLEANYVSKSTEINWIVLKIVLHLRLHKYYISMEKC